MDQLKETTYIEDEIEKVHHRSEEQNTIGVELVPKYQGYTRHLIFILHDYHARHAFKPLALKHLYNTKIIKGSFK